MFLPALRIRDVDCPRVPPPPGLVRDVTLALPGKRSTQNCRFCQTGVHGNGGQRNEIIENSFAQHSLAH